MRAILTFHSIDNSGAIVSYPIKKFAELLEKLRKSNIPILSLDQILADPFKQGVVITFDDGMRSVYENALPILKEYAAPAHVFIATAAIENTENIEQAITIGDFDMLSWHEIEQLQASGIQVDAHTHRHPDMRTINKEQILEEFHLSHEILASKIGVTPNYFAYPFGYHNQLARDCAADFYKASMTTELKPLSKNYDEAAIPRLDSFYFQTSNAINNLDSSMMTMYLKLRNAMRNVKGSQCKATAK
ncbi:MAG: polysaccharide deacetylase family protein [Cycloclasticus sp.]|nr:polysaccharide deacetylase family protein [Cycloclasticus sp.]